MSESEKPSARDKLVVFYGADAPSLHEASMSTGRSHVADEPMDDFFSESIAKDVKTSVPFKQEAPDGLSLVSLDFPPGAMLPRHSHSTDCLYYIVTGGIAMGQRQLGPGDGFFAPSDQPYAYRVGSEGVKLLEFRGSTAFDTKFHENAARFRDRAEASLAEAASGSTKTNIGH